MGRMGKCAMEIECDGPAYFAESVLFGCFFLIEAEPDAEVVEAGVGPERLIRARSLAVSVVCSSATRGKPDITLRLW